MCNQSINERMFKKVLKRVEKNLEKRRMFTALDIAIKLQEKNFYIKVSQVTKVMKELVESGNYPEMESTFINVVNSDNEVVAATLYHPYGSDTFDYKKINQVRPEMDEEMKNAFFNEMQ